jgi:hypothetical protein
VLAAGLACRDEDGWWHISALETMIAGL